MIIPLHVDVPMSRVPCANFAMIGATVLASLLLFSSMESAEHYVLDGLKAPGIVTHMFLHAGFLHLFGNMLFLWVFGNAICAKVGNLWFPLLYVGLGLAAALVHVFGDGALAIGASGAINGVVGMFLVLYPRNTITCAVFVSFYPLTFTASSGWIILYWLAFDVLGAALGLASTAYVAHLGGFAAGAVIAITLLATGLIAPTRYEQTAIDLILRRSPGAA